METESITEGWVKFTRKHFAIGFIDRWIGDCINNPNNPSCHQMQSNSFATYYRLNGAGLWINNHDLFKMSYHWTLIDLSAEMIWENCYTDYQNILTQNQTKG